MEVYTLCGTNHHLYKIKLNIQMMGIQASTYQWTQDESDQNQIIIQLSLLLKQSRLEKHKFLLTTSRLHKNLHLQPPSHAQAHTQGLSHLYLWVSSFLFKHHRYLKVHLTGYLAPWGSYSSLLILFIWTNQKLQATTKKNRNRIIDREQDDS